MDIGILGEQYKITETLCSNEIHNVYLAKDVSNFNKEQVIINEFVNIDIAKKLDTCFNSQLSGKMDTFIKAFYMDTIFYVVGKLYSGHILSNYLSDNSIRLSDKMYIVENLLSSLSKLDNIQPCLIYLLCDTDCISIAGRSNVYFNMYFTPTPSALNADKAATISKIADIMCCVFANSPKAALQTDKDNIPPTMAAIIKKCYEGQYNSFSDIHKAFKASLLYSTFIDNTSVDKQVMKNIEKAKRKKKFGFVKNIAAVLIIAALAFSFWHFKGASLFNKAVPASNEEDISTTPAANSKPTAKFTSSLSKITAGDEVLFVNESTDPDIDDSIVSYQWTMSKDNGLKQVFSNEQSPSCIFDAPGEYVINLTVKDSKGAESDGYSFSFTVYPKEELPESDGTKSSSKGDYK